MTIGELNFRRNLCQFCIKTLDQMPNDTKGKQDAMTEYKRQLAEIDKQITEITGTPPPINVALKTAVMFPKANLN